MSDVHLSLVHPVGGGFTLVLELALHLVHYVLQGNHPRPLRTRGPRVLTGSAPFPALRCRGVFKSERVKPDVKKRWHGG